MYLGYGKMRRIVYGWSGRVEKEKLMLVMVFLAIPHWDDCENLTFSTMGHLVQGTTSTMMDDGYCCCLIGRGSAVRRAL